MLIGCTAALLFLGAHAPAAAKPDINRATVQKIDNTLKPAEVKFPDRTKQASEAQAYDAKQAADRAAADAAAQAQLAQAREVQPVQVQQTYAWPIGSHADWMTAAGIDPEDYGYVDFIVSHESGWNPNAVNRNGGACGLGQQLPCGKWPGAWNDPVAALRAMNVYVNNYGGWAGAYSFWRNHNWY